MKKIVILLIFLLLLFVKPNKEVKALIEDQPYNTKIIGLNHQLVNSNLAYEGILILNPNMQDPTDIFIDQNDIAYITDRGNKVVYRYKIKDKIFDTIGEGILEGPTGVSVGNDNLIYVADYGSKKIIVFNQIGEVVKEYEKPKEALYGNNLDFRPTKISVDNALNLYITSEGNANGVVRISPEGEFMGYFAPNNVSITLGLLFRRFFLSKEDKDTYASLNPKASTNLFVDKRNILYTIIDGEKNVSLKKFNIQGNNILSGIPFYSDSYQDITVDNDGFIYAIDHNSDGCISMMDNEGNLLFRFGKTETDSMKMGQFEGASGIAVDSEGNIWAVDQVGRNIQVFMKTEFAEQVIRAKQLYNNGNYVEAEVLFQEILKENSNFVEAYQGLGEIKMRERKFDEALDYFRIANDKSGYSDAFWEVRDSYLSEYLIVFIILIVVIIIWRVFHLKKYVLRVVPDKVNEFNSKIKNSNFIQEIKLLPRVLKKPFDVFYDIKFKQKVKLRTAVILFFAFIVIMILSDYVISGYIFRADTSNLNLSFEFLKWGLAIFLFTIANHLISSLQNGEGFYRDIFIGIVFAFAPMLIFYLPLAIVSNVLTFNEAFLFNLAKTVLYIWCIFNCLIMIKNIQNYTIGQFILNIVLTFVTMMILIFLYLIVYILCMQLIDFVGGIISEVFMT